MSPSCIERPFENDQSRRMARVDLGANPSDATLRIALVELPGELLLRVPSKVEGIKVGSRVFIRIDDLKMRKERIRSVGNQNTVAPGVVVRCQDLCEDLAQMRSIVEATNSDRLACPAPVRNMRGDRGGMALPNHAEVGAEPRSG